MRVDILDNRVISKPVEKHPFLYWFKDISTIDLKDTDLKGKKRKSRHACLIITTGLVVLAHQRKLSFTWPVVNVVERATLGGHVAQVDLLVLNLNLQVENNKLRSSQTSR